ncbi:Early nodulin-like protein 1 [Rhynchospora pubera]|uniref:Early nodulin-like protein 1 n=1 Tax=Rhynchospora pubera TaxID=906938 RepID=A0AAV8HHW8_9POAL|nr:Early nodulin-like protein 1 [Rhynchospora pubera]
MASPSITPFSFNSILVLAASTTLLLSISSAHEFIVGGPTGWIVPPAEDPQLYNLWANMNCFHVGDFLNFQNATDSVLVVSSLDKYMQCNTTDPIQELPPGNSVFQFPRHGFFYFISSEVDHCLARQRMTVHVVVMVHLEVRNHIRSAMNRAPCRVVIILVLLWWLVRLMELLELFLRLFPDGCVLDFIVSAVAFLTNFELLDSSLGLSGACLIKGSLGA